VCAQIFRLVYESLARSRSACTFYRTGGRESEALLGTLTHITRSPAHARTCLVRDTYNSTKTASAAFLPPLFPSESTPVARPTPNRPVCTTGRPHGGCRGRPSALGALPLREALPLFALVVGCVARDTADHGRHRSGGGRGRQQRQRQQQAVARPVTRSWQRVVGGRSTRTTPRIRRAGACCCARGAAPWRVAAVGWEQRWRQRIRLRCRLAPGRWRRGYRRCQITLHDRRARRAFVGQHRATW
jgi:hypothetical protein